MKGLVHIYTGDGKGKTTAAVGLGVRAFGRGLRVLMVQFFKGRKTGEAEVLKGLEPDFKLCRGRASGKFTWQMDEHELAKAKHEMNRLLEESVRDAFDGNWDMLILDEILGAVKAGMIEESRVEGVITGKPEGLEIVLTGRDAPERLIALADYVSEIKAVKHPAERGISARKGIEE